MENTSRIKDSWEKTFSDYNLLLKEEEDIEISSQWVDVPCKSLKVFPILGVYKDITEDYTYVGRGRKKEIRTRVRKELSDFTCDAAYLKRLKELPFQVIADTIENTGIGINFVTDSGVEYTYPVRDTAIKGLFDRAKIGGESFKVMSTKEMADILNICLNLYDKNIAQVLIRDKKISAIVSGDNGQYSIMPTIDLIESLEKGLQKKFGKPRFESASKCHSLTAVSFKLPDKKEELLKNYISKLKKAGRDIISQNIYPGIKFSTSDTGISVARCSAFLYGNGAPITIGSALEMPHRRNNTVKKFQEELEGLFSNFGNTVEKLEKLLDIQIEYPYSCMERICKKFKMPKAASYEALQQLEMIYGDNPCTAHDIYMQMQEIPFTCRTQENPLSPLKIFEIEENLGKVLSIHWKDFDIEKRCEW